MGNAYEHLIGKFADDAGNTAQEFYTNRTVVDLMVEILEPKAQESIYDPTCGTGGMLISCIAKLKNPDNPNDNSWREIRAYGQELKPLTATIARTNLFLHGVEEFRIVKDDTLTRPAFTSGGKLQTFDVVLANPPYSIKHWNRDLFMNDPYGRNFLGTPPQGRADYAFIQHILKSMDPEKGRCAILLPHGVLNRLAERSMRAELVKLDWLDCVIGIGKNLFYNSPMEACILIANRNKPESHRGKVIFVSAKKLVVRKNTESYLLPEHISKIALACHDFKDVRGFAKVVTNEEIAVNSNSLAVNKYVQEQKAVSDVVNMNNLISAWNKDDDETNLSLVSLMKEW
jgi:type I restriction enzyme M protein